MAKPYSMDLRNRVVAAVTDHGMSCHAAASRFGVAELAERDVKVDYVQVWRFAHAHGLSFKNANIYLTYLRAWHPPLEEASTVFDLTNPIYHDAEKARQHLENLHWPNGPVCPRCGEMKRVKRLEGKSTRPGVIKCYQYD